LAAINGELVVEGRALRALKVPSQGIVSFIPFKLVVPMENIEFALVGPIFSASDVAVTDRIIHNEVPFLRVRFASA